MELSLRSRQIHFASFNKFYLPSHINYNIFVLEMTQEENPVPKRVYDDISYEVKPQFIIESHQTDQLYSGGSFAH